ncbi:MAG TPA: spondin domain-containing protein, partial [Polyangiaceae bacterium]
LPGDAFELVVNGNCGQMLHFESMFGQSNDTYVTTPSGIALFDAQCMPRHGDVTAMVSLWDAGSERNEAPGMGPNQAPRQPMPNSGPGELGVFRRTDPTRAIPIPAALVDVAVSKTNGAYSITLTNRSDHGPLMSPLSPVFYALHGAGYRYLTAGMPASPGLERLAEEGNSSPLISEATSAGATAAAAGSAPFGPGASVTFTVTPTPSLQRLTLAMMIGQTNDCFIGTQPEGVMLVDGSGMPRAADDVASDIRDMLATWDAGTEANEVPGVGPNQAPRQPAANTGPADPDAKVRLYADSSNDLATLSGLIQVTVAAGSNGSFDVTLMNQSGASAFPLIVSRVAWATHGDGFSAFMPGQPASAGIEALAEDGNPTPLLGEWGAIANVSATGIAGTAPFTSGQSVTLNVTPDAMHRYLSFAAMLVPSNDTFAALGPQGVALLDVTGNPRAAASIAADIMEQLAAWDAGTEANQGGALGPDMAPHQAAPNTGKSEGSGKARSVDGVWPFPQANLLLKVTLTPM